MRLTIFLAFGIVSCLSAFSQGIRNNLAGKQFDTITSDSIQVSVSAGWNLISFPLSVPDGRVNILFPSAISNAFKYDGSYIVEYTLQPGTGYWLKFAEPVNISIIGTTIPVLNSNMKLGWNMVGSPNEKIAGNQLVTQPCEIISSDYFAYTPGYGYGQMDTLEPGKGYWVKVSQAGNLLEKKWIKVSDIYYAGVTVHPTEPNILYAGTQSNFDAGTNGAIMKSTDWGATWDTLLRDVSSSRVLLDQTNPNVGYVTVQSGIDCIPGILKTTDGGLTWLHADNGVNLSWGCQESFGQFMIDPSNSNILYVQIIIFDTRPLHITYKTINGGNYWFPLINYDSLHCTCSTDTFRRFSEGVLLAIDPQNSNILYALELGISYSVGVNILFRSTTAGETWDILYRFPKSTLGYPANIEVDIRDSNILYIGANGFFRSTDRGQSWQNSSNGLPDPIYPNVHQSKNSDVLFISTGSGSIFQSTDKGLNWQTQIIDSSYGVYFQDLDETGSSIYSTKIDTGYYHPTEIDGLYRLKICK
jgi:hypothetical protein